MYPVAVPLNAHASIIQTCIHYMYICIYNYTYYIHGTRTLPQAYPCVLCIWSVYTYSGSTLLRALPPLHLLQLLLVLLHHVCEAIYILICLLQQVHQALVLLLVNQLTIALLIFCLYVQVHGTKRRCTCTVYVQCTYMYMYVKQNIHVHVCTTYM